PMPTDDVAPAPSRARRSRSERLTATWLPRAPVVVFAAVGMFALVLWMAAGRYLWFYLDDWDFLAARRTGSVGDLFRPHNEHWTTAPTPLFPNSFLRAGGA